MRPRDRRIFGKNQFTISKSDYGFTESDQGRERAENWMADFEIFFSDQNDYDFKEYIKTDVSRTLLFLM